MALKLLETNAKERCNYFSSEKTDDSKIHKKNHKKFRVEKQQTVAVEIQKKIII